MNISYKKWSIIVLALSMIIPAITAGINYFMDPLWCFSPSHRYNQKQDDFNERQQKTNWVAYHRFDYDALIIGSSTSTNLNQNFFRNIRAYNYACNGLNPVEYLPYMQFARERNGRDFKYIIMGLDFMLTAEMPPLQLEADRIISDTRNPLYRIKTLISIDTLMHSRRNFMNYLYGRHIYYDRNNIKHATRLSAKDIEFNIARLIEHFRKSDAPYSYNHYRYNRKYRSDLARIRAAFPRAKFIVFTAPAVDQYLSLMVSCNALDAYEQWIRDIVSVYGECYDFLIPGWLSKQYLQYFHDPNHYYPFVADMMIDAMYNSGNPESSGICMHITRDNIDKKLARIRKLMLQLPPAPAPGP